MRPADALSVGPAAATVYRRHSAATKRSMVPALSLPDGRRLALGPTPLIMGIVNVTPDSFSGDGLLAAGGDAVAHGLRLAAEGAAILDVGGESTRPDHAPLDAATEQARVLPVIEALAAAGATPVSIDSWKAEVADAALAAGASIVNDVWGAQRDPAIAEVAARRGAPIILMHNRNTVDPGLDILSEVMRFLERSIAIARAAGVPLEQIVVDPGIGRFGKTAEQSLTLLRELPRLAELGCPILLGASRKSVIGVLTGQEVPAERVAGSIAAHLHGVAQGVAIIRVHDVAEHAQALKVWSALTLPAERAS
jgi:dihydropteroate synthase